ncbi:MAG: HAMP domain-containing histidine kinase [Pseudodesulfovibrio sp.]|nr:HAMP domain-containing histidine kinase [Pseudodesulfovibrio sp.]
MTPTTSNSRDDLQFFGKINASASHEIKNVFAVINEAAGLVEDLTLMSEKGMPIEPERLKRVAKSIQGQIRRGDDIIKNMNAFAHSMDEGAKEVNLEETLGLTVALSTRMADMKQIGLEQGKCEPATALVCPFDLMRLLHGVIAAALDTMTQGSVLTVAARPSTDGATFTISSSGQVITLENDTAFAELAKQMNATITNNEKDGVLELFLKKTA